MKKSYSLLAFLLIALLFMGCAGQSVEKPEQVLKLIDTAVKITEQAAKDKDIKLAREVWTQISEYGVKAKELEKKELADSLGKLASTYVYLVSYIETGDNNQLTIFRNSFEQAVAQLRKCVAAQQQAQVDNRQSKK